MRNKQARPIIICLVLLLMIISTRPSFAVPQKISKLFVRLDDQLGSGLQLYINRDDLVHDLSEGDYKLRLYFDGRSLLKAEDTYPQNIKVEIYTNTGGEKKLLTILNRTVKNEKAAKHVLLITKIPRLEESTDLHFDIHDAHNVIDATFIQRIDISKSSGALTTQANVPDFNCAADDGECLIEYILRHVTFSANYDRHLKTEIHKNDKGRYTVNIPVKKGRKLGKKVRKFNANGGGNGGDTINNSLPLGSYPFFEDEEETGRLFWDSINQAIKFNFGNNGNIFSFNKDGSFGLGPNLVFSQGSLMSTPQDGALEYDGNDLFFTIGSTRTSILSPGTSSVIDLSNGGTLNGDINFIASSMINNAVFNGSFQYRTGAGTGLVLTSDTNGVATWQAAAGGSDNLGNHNALQRIDMGGFTLRNTDQVNGNTANFTTVNSTDLNTANGNFTSLAYFDNSSQIQINGSLFIPTGAANGFVLASDANGFATWVSSASLSGTGDNLGNHNALQRIDMGGFTLRNADQVNGNTANFNDVNAINGNFTTANSTDLNITNNGYFANSSKLQINGALAIKPGAANGFVLTSDANGNATWQAAAGGSDNLGNHNALQRIDMGGFTLRGADQVNGNTANFTNGNITTITSTTINNTDLNTANGNFTSLAYFDNSSHVQINGNLFIPAGAANGFVLASDANGFATWVSSASLSGAGDNLGNHNALQRLDMGGFTLRNADQVNGATANFTNTNTTNITSTGFALFNGSSNLQVNGSLTIKPGAVAGYVLSSDINGTASWQSVSSLVNGGSAALSSGIAGAIQFSDGAGGFDSNDSGIFWDNNNGAALIGDRANGNTHIGLSAGLSSTGQYNINIGSFAGGFSSSNGTTSIGSEAGSQSSGINSTFIGYRAGRQNTADSVFASGFNSGRQNQGNGLVAIGTSSAYLNRGLNVAAIGRGSAFFNRGDNLVSIGTDSSSANRGNNVISFGASSARNNLGNGAIAVGQDTLRFNNGAEAIALGNRALYGNNGDYNIAIGYLAGDSNIQGSDDILIGHDAEPASTTQNGQLNIGNTIYGDLINGEIALGKVTANPAATLELNGSFIYTDGTEAAGFVLTSDANGLASWQAAAGGGGTSSGIAGSVQFSDGANGFDSDAGNFFWNNATKRLGIGIAPTAAIHVDGYGLIGDSSRGAIALGLNAASALRSTSQRVNALGNYAAQNSNGNEINAFGYSAVRNSIGDRINALGYSAATLNAGNDVNAIGSFAANNNTGSNLNAFGYNAAYYNSGNHVNAIGNNSAHFNNGDFTQAFGYQALYANNGNHNLGIGYRAGYYTRNGSENIMIGRNTDVADPNLNKQINIGNTIYGGNGKVALGIVKADAAATLEVNGSFMYTDGNETAGYVLTSDATGFASWQAAPVTGGDTNGQVFVVNSNVISNNGSSADYQDDFVIGSPSLNDDTNPNHDSRMFFNKSRGAFRAGNPTSTQWDDFRIGNGSTAFGASIANGNYSTAFGGGHASGFYSTAWGNGARSANLYSTAWGFFTESTAGLSTAWGDRTNAVAIASTAWGGFTYANGDYSTAWGRLTFPSGEASTAWGFGTKTTGDYATAWGSSTNAGADGATAWGFNTAANGTYSTAFGTNLETNGTQAIIFGSGNSSTDRLTNNQGDSLAVGFNSNATTLFVGPSAGGSTTGNIGIATTAPAAKLDIIGDIKITDGTEAAGFVLTSDANGLASWQAAAGGGASSGIAGSVQFSDGANGFDSDAANFFWDDTNKRLGINITPTAAFHVNGYALIGDSANDVIALGPFAAHLMVTGSEDVNAFGNSTAMFNNGDDINAFGSAAAQSNRGDDVNAIGSSAALSNTGDNVNVMGIQAAAGNTGNNLNAMGYFAALSNQGNDVNALGLRAAQSSTGNNINALGAFSATSNTGNNLNAMGYGIAYNNSGNNVNAIGYNAAFYNNGNYAQAIGYQTLYANNGDYNIAMGYRAGYNTRNGSENIMIGRGADVANPNGDYQLNIGNTISGNFNNNEIAIGKVTENPAATLEVNGSVQVNELLYYDDSPNNTSAGAVTIDWNNGNRQEITMGHNVTFTFTDPPGVASLSLVLIQDGTGSRTATWPASIHWANGVTPTLTTAAGQLDIVTCLFRAGTYYCQAALNFAP